MTEALKTLLFLNIQGSMFVIILLLLKKIVQKAFSGKIQRVLWICAALMFLIPVWKAVPINVDAPILLPHYEGEIPNHEEVIAFEENRDFTINENTGVNELFLLPWIWGIGAITFLLLNILSYAIFIMRMQRESESFEDTLFEGILTKKSIKRSIRLKMSKDVDSPMLVGVVFPVVYITRDIPKIDREYIYLHELTHYKHKDLAIKWFGCIVNAIFWFNPFVYLTINNLNEACEIYCDEDVTESMTADGKRAYMNTILNLVTMKGERDV